MAKQRRTNTALWFGTAATASGAAKVLETETAKGAETALELATGRASTFHYLNARER